LRLIKKNGGMAAIKPELGKYYGRNEIYEIVGDELLELVVFVLDEAEAFGFVDFESAKLLPPLVEGGLAAPRRRQSSATGLAG
jgi:hypothetical protein